MIRFGICGAGSIAKKFARDLKFVEEAKLTAVSARNEKSALEHQKEFETEFAFSSYEAMAKSDVIDAVYIATPHNFHYEQALLFMRHKKHVLIEKPITVNSKQLEDLIKVAKENNVLMMEAMWTYFLPATIWLKKIIDDNILGKLKEATIKFGFPITIGKGKDSRLLNPHLAGGALLDLGVYTVYYYLLLKGGEPETIRANAEFTDTGVDGTGIVEIIENADTKFILNYSMTKILLDKATLKFEHGQIIMNDFHGCQKVKLNKKWISIPYEGEGFVHEIRSFVESIENGQVENDIIPFKKSLESMKLLDLIREQIKLTYPFESE